MAVQELLQEKDVIDFNFSKIKSQTNSPHFIFTTSKSQKILKRGELLKNSSKPKPLKTCSNNVFHDKSD